MKWENGVKRPLSDIAHGLELGQDGIWRTSQAARVSFPDHGNRLCFEVEDGSFWFEHRKQCLLTLLAKFPSSGQFFDVGGGNGYMTAAVQQAGQDVVLIEPGQEGARNAQGRGLGQIVCGRLEDAAFLPQTMPAIGLFDVLEHIEDDGGFLTICHKLLLPGGRIYLMVPAMHMLWSSEDELAGHFRRYRLAELTRLFEKSGYAVEFASYFFEFLILPVLLKRAIPYRLGFKKQAETEEAVRADHVVSNGWPGRVIRACCARELRRIGGLEQLRAGTSLVLVARSVAR